jgi:hypothetical protein
LECSIKCFSPDKKNNLQDFQYQRYTGIFLSLREKERERARERESARAKERARARAGKGKRERENKSAGDYISKPARPA